VSKKNLPAGGQKKGAAQAAWQVGQKEPELTGGRQKRAVVSSEAKRRGKKGGVIGLEKWRREEKKKLQVWRSVEGWGVPPLRHVEKGRGDELPVRLSEPGTKKLKHWWGVGGTEGKRPSSKIKRKSDSPGKNMKENHPKQNKKGGVLSHSFSLLTHRKNP